MECGRKVYIVPAVHICQYILKISLNSRAKSLPFVGLRALRYAADSAVILLEFYLEPNATDVVAPLRVVACI
jgi:hypothetical protein